MPAPRSISPLVPGAVLARYVLVAPIAHGGMGEVWRARWTGAYGLAKDVAIKVLLPTLATAPRARAMLADEARIAMRIAHVNVAETLELGEAEGRLFLVMEWVDGASLARLAGTLHDQGRSVPLGVALAVVADVCRGLHAAHELRDAEGAAMEVIHRDVSPQNVMIRRDGVVKVIDFGVARARGRFAGETTHAGQRGKVRYMAPEQATGKPVDRRADVWAAGAVLYELLTGSVPHDGENDAVVLTAHLEGRAPAPLPPTVPAVVARIVKRALAPSPTDRFPTAEAFANALSEASADLDLVVSASDVRAAFADAFPVAENVAAPLETSVVLVPPRPTRRRWRAGLVSLAIVGAAGAMAFGFRARTAATASAAPSAPAVEPVVEPAPPVVSAPVPREVAPVPPASHRAVTRRQHAPPQESAAPAPVVEPTPTATSRTPTNCDPPYVIDSAGRRVYRRECL